MYNWPWDMLPIFEIVLFCCPLMRNNWLYCCSRLESAPNHLSFQNLTLSPPPTFHTMCWWIELNSGCWNNFQRSLHHWECQTLSLPLLRSAQPPYLDVKILTHNWFWLEDKAYIHLPIKAALNLEISLILSPPTSLGRQMTSHYTHAIFLSSWEPPHRKFLCKDINFRTNLYGILKKDRRYMGRAVNTEFIKVTFPAIDRIFWFHLDNFASNFLISGFHIK